MATPEDLRGFEAKKGEVNIGKVFFMMSHFQWGRLFHIPLILPASLFVYISKTRFLTRRLTLAAFRDVADKTESYKGLQILRGFNLLV